MVALQLNSIPVITCKLSIHNVHEIILRSVRLNITRKYIIVAIALSLRSPKFFCLGATLLTSDRLGGKSKKFNLPKIIMSNEQEAIYS